MSSRSYNNFIDWNTRVLLQCVNNGFRDSLRMGSTIAQTIMDTNDGLPVDKITLPPIPVVYDCESVFENLPDIFWEYEAFQRNISEEMYAQYAG